MSMNFLNKRECHFCGIIIRDENFEEINDIIKEKLGTLLMKLPRDKEVQYVTCKVCYAKLYAASIFKTLCLRKNDTIIRNVDFESSKQIYLKQKGISILKNQEVCRLCLQPTDGKHKSMQDVPSKIVEIYIPEINFAETTDPAICLKCIDALCIHTTFIQSCLDVEKNRNMNEIELRDILLTNDVIKTEAIEIKSEETGEDESYFKITYLDTTKADNAERDPSGHSTKGLMNMEEDKIRNDLNNLDQRTISAQSVDTNCKSKERIYKTKEICRCDECGYNSHNKVYMKDHPLTHKDPSEVQLYQCEKCKFVTKCRRSLWQHQLRYEDPSQVQNETVHKQYLNYHKLVTHSSTSFKCGHCPYEAKYRSHIENHLIKHAHSWELELFQCSKCDFKTKRKQNLTRHEQRHKDPSEATMYECSVCDYKTVQKYNLIRHLWRHKNVSELQLFSCDQYTSSSPVQTQ